MRYHTRNRRRLQALRDHHERNGIDYLEVSDTTAVSRDLRQRTLILQLVEPLKAGTVPTWRDVTITGGDRFPSVAVEWVARGDALPAGEDAAPLAEFDDPASLLIVRTRRDDPSRGRGDHSEYVLKLERAEDWGFDLVLSSVPFTFKVECPSPFDCAADCFCSDSGAKDDRAPVIDYLAKDFVSLRRVMLDRMRVLMPGWTERHAPDLLIALTELVAYRADQLSYRQDAIATEALFATARDRISLRRHARMLDYRVDEGVAARTFVQITVTNPVTLPAGVPILTARNAAGAVLTMDDLDLRNQLLADPATIVFETMEPATLTPDLHHFHFWGHGELEPVIAAGATAATLMGVHPGLRAGDALLLQEIRNPASGEFPDASPDPDPDNAQIVRLTSVRATEDPLGGTLTGGAAGPLSVTEITWADEDALRRPLCLTADNGATRAAVAFGNIVLADHGRTMPWRELPPVPEALLRRPADCDGPGDELPVRYRPRIPAQHVSVTEPLEDRVLAEASDDAAFRGALDSRADAPVRAWLSARGLAFDKTLAISGQGGAWSVADSDRAVLIDLRDDRLVVRELPPAAATLLTPRSDRARPAVRVLRDDVPWSPRPDLLGSGPNDRHFVAERDSEGAVLLRFGDDLNGQAADGGAVWRASWRDRGRTLGNIGRETLLLIDGSLLPGVDEARQADARTALQEVVGVTNPLAATGGRDGVSDETIRRDAPHAIWGQRRAVTPDDYARRASSARGVQRAVATTRWTGSWYTTALAIDPLGGGTVGDTLADTVRSHVEPWRMAGTDLELDDAIPVSLIITLDVEVEADRLAPHVERALLRELGSGRTGAGTPALFHPDRITFGQDVALSPIVAAAAAVPGVKAVAVREFRRAEGDTADRVADGVIALGRFEIARCDNDPDHPDRGTLSLRMGGGR